MTTSQSRAATRRDDDHQFVPTAARVSPKTCQVCGLEGYTAYVGPNRGRWHHGTRPSVAISHPEATIIFNGGHRRHYPRPRFDGATLCGRAWKDRGRTLRLSDGIRGGVCLDCLEELNKASARSIPAGSPWS